MSGPTIAKIRPKSIMLKIELNMLSGISQSMLTPYPFIMRQYCYKNYCLNVLLEYLRRREQWFLLFQYILNVLLECMYLLIYTEGFIR